ncbi:MAG: enolase C-terminal domain-like protein, partial [Bryobacteraceae bacterium]
MPGVLNIAVLNISAVEIWKYEGHHEALSGVDRQYQANPMYVYDELRPKPYHDNPHPKSITVPVTALYLKIKTAEGAEGLYGPIDPEAAVVINRQLRSFLLGKNALAQEKLWDEMWRSNRHARRGHFLMAIGAVDNAVWDLRGRALNTPVYRLLGGPTRDRVEVYGSTLGSSLEPEKARARAVQLKQQGFQHQKWFLADGPATGNDGMKRNVELVRLLRETVGDDVELMFDVFQGWDLNYALAWSKQVERYRPRWLEEAFSPEKIDAFADLRRHTSIPIASGEHFYGRWEVYDFLKAHALDVVQADPEWCGGISELVKICAVASLYDVKVIP